MPDATYNPDMPSPTLEGWAFTQAVFAATTLWSNEPELLDVLHVYDWIVANDKAECGMERILREYIVHRWPIMELTGAGIQKRAWFSAFLHQNGLSWSYKVEGKTPDSQAVFTIMRDDLLAYLNLMEDKGYTTMTLGTAPHAIEITPGQIRSILAGTRE